MAGTYAAQTVLPDTSKTTGLDVIFQPVGAVTLGGLKITASHVEFRNMTTPGWTVNPGSAFVTLRNVTSTAPIFITSASNVSVLGGSAGPAAGTYLANGSQIKAATSSTVPPRNIVIDGVTFHDYRKAPGTANHVDCLHIMSGDGITIRNSNFYNCEAFNVLFTVYGSAGSPKNVLVDNNSFQCCYSGYYTLMLGGGHGEVFTNFVIRNNTSNGRTMSTGTTNTLINVRFSSNLGGVAGCQRLPTGMCS